MIFMPNAFRQTAFTLVGGLSFLFAENGVLAQNFYQTNYNSSYESNEMTVGEMLASQEIRNAERTPENRGQSVPVQMTRLERPENFGTSQAVYESQTMGNQGETRIQQVSYETTARATSQGIPAPASAVEKSQPSVEPKTLPEDFPAGEMAPLNAQNLICFSEVVTLPEGPFQQVTIIDPTQKVLCVYHINMGTGQIELKSARKIEWDLQLIFLNSQKPLPQDVQAILQQTQRRK